MPSFMKPARGIVSVRPIETQEHLPGGRIILTEKTREALAANQYEVVAVGFASPCEKPEECDRPTHGWRYDHRKKKRYYHHPTDSRIRPGAWVYVTPRSLVNAGTDEKLFFCRIDDLLGVFRA
jgi:hypothetical protein